MRKFRLALGLAFLLCTGGNPNLVASGHSGQKYLLGLSPNSTYGEIAARLAGGLIMVQARLNGQAGNYILDTGASHLFINQDLVDQQTIQAYGIGNQVSVQSGLVAHFEIGTVSFSNQSVYKMDMRHLEALKGCRIAGIIGTELLKNFTLFVDYKNGIVRLTPADQSAISASKHVLRTYAFKMQGHFPMLSVLVNDVEYDFALDTGAEANIFAEKFEKELSAQTKDLRAGRVGGIANSATQVRNFTLTEMECLGLNYQTMGFMFSDLAAFNNAYAVELDGILGYPFLRRYPFTIDFSEKKLILWQDSNRNFPKS